MSAITSLSEELLFHIFNHLVELTDAAECRLVCRAWNGPAERAMFGHKISLTTDEDKMRALHTVLSKNPTKSHWIKQLEFEINNTHQYPEALIHELIMLTLTPNIHSITGYVHDPLVLSRITDIMQQSTNKFDKIRELTVICSHDTLQNLALLCKETLEKLVISGLPDWPFIARLEEFPRLISLALDLEVADMSSLDGILDSCPHLQDLSLFIEKWQESSNSDRPAWNQQTTSKHLHLKSLKAVSFEKWCSVELVEYLLYKLINLKKISICFYVRGCLDDHTLRDIPELIKQVPEKELVYNVRNIADAGDIMRLTKVYPTFAVDKIEPSTYRITL